MSENREIHKNDHCENQVFQSYIAILSQNKQANICDIGHAFKIWYVRQIDSETVLLVLISRFLVSYNMLDNSCANEATHSGDNSPDPELS